MLTLIKDGSHPSLSFVRCYWFVSGWFSVGLGWVLCMGEGLIVFNFSFVKDNGGEILYRDSVEMCECRFYFICWKAELVVESLKGGDVGGASCSCCEDEYWGGGPA